MLAAAEAAVIVAVAAVEKDRLGERNRGPCHNQCDQPHPQGPGWNHGGPALTISAAFCLLRLDLSSTNPPQNEQRPVSRLRKGCAGARGSPHRLGKLSEGKASKEADRILASLAVVVWVAAVRRQCHFVLTSLAIRHAIIQRLGARSFQTPYSLVALVTLMVLVRTYCQRHHAGSLLWADLLARVASGQGPRRRRIGGLCGYGQAAWTSSRRVSTKGAGERHP